MHRRIALEEQRGELACSIGLQSHQEAIRASGRRGEGDDRADLNADAGHAQVSGLTLPPCVARRGLARTPTGDRQYGHACLESYRHRSHHTHERATLASDHAVKVHRVPVKCKIKHRTGLLWSCGSPGPFRWRVVRTCRGTCGSPGTPSLEGAGGGRGSQCGRRVADVWGPVRPCALPGSPGGGRAHRGAAAGVSSGGSWRSHTHRLPRDMHAAPRSGAGGWREDAVEYAGGKASRAACAAQAHDTRPDPWVPLRGCPRLFTRAAAPRGSGWPRGVGVAHGAGPPCTTAPGPAQGSTDPFAEPQGSAARPRGGTG